MDFTVKEISLINLDSTSADVAFVYLHKEERPLQGLPGLIDWRLNSRISFILKSNFFQCEIGETLLYIIPFRLRINALVIIGAGSIKNYNLMRYKELIQKTFSIIKGLKIKRIVLTMPPWYILNLKPLQALDFWLNEFSLVLSKGYFDDCNICLFTESAFVSQLKQNIMNFVRKKQF